MSDKSTNIAVLVAVIACALLLCIGTGFASYYAGKHRAFKDAPRDTVTTVVTIRDTVTVKEPEYITKTVIRRELIPVTDTLQIHDTTYIAMDVERKVYADSNYRAVVSGIRPSLDEISVFPETKIVTQTVTVYEPKKPTRFGLGVQAGFGGTYGLVGKQFDVGPYLGIGLSYNFVRF